MLDSQAFFLCPTPLVPLNLTLVNIVHGCLIQSILLQDAARGTCCLGKYLSAFSMTRSRLQPPRRKGYKFKGTSCSYVSLILTSKLVSTAKSLRTLTGSVRAELATQFQYQLSNKLLRMSWLSAAPYHYLNGERRVCSSSTDHDHRR